MTWGTTTAILPWTNRFTSAITTIVSSSSQSQMVDPDWIQILRKATPTSSSPAKVSSYLPFVKIANRNPWYDKMRLPVCKEKVTVYVTRQCSENSYFWRVIDHKYQASCCVAWCTVLTAAYIPQHFLRNRIKQTTLLKCVAVLGIK